MKNIDRAAAARSMVALSNSAGKKRYTPKTSLVLTFLHSEDIIVNHASILETVGKPMMNGIIMGMLNYQAVSMETYTLRKQRTNLTWGLKRIHRITILLIEMK